MIQINEFGRGAPTIGLLLAGRRPRGSAGFFDISRKTCMNDKEKWIVPFRWFSWVVVLLMLLAMGYAGVMALTHYSAIAV